MTEGNGRHRPRLRMIDVLSVDTRRLSRCVSAETKESVLWCEVRQKVKLVCLKQKKLQEKA